MGWRDRCAAHVLLDEGDFTQLDALPKTVAFQVRLFQTGDRNLWFIGTRANLKKWGKTDDPFSEFAPLGSPKFAKLAADSATPFCLALDELCGFAKEFFSDSPFVGFGPCKKIGELSLGLQISTLVGKRVLTIIDDDDPVEAMFACACDSGRVIRARCEKAGIHLVFEGGETIVSQVTNRGNMPPHGAIPPEGFSPTPTIDMSSVLDQLARIPGVRKGSQPPDYVGWSKQLVSQELNAYVGANIAVPDTVVPSYSTMKLLAQRAAGNKIKTFK